MMLRMGFPLAVLRSKLRPVGARTPAFQPCTRSCALCAQWLSSVTRMASILRAWANPMTLLGSTGSFFSTRSGVLEHAHPVVAGAPGQGAKIALLALARRIVGADPAVVGDLSQLNPLGIRTAQAAFLTAKQCIKDSNF
jgi:hypothetical protein